MARKNAVTERDVSGGGFIDERGRHINTDVPEEARRGAKSKSNARKRLKQKQREADKRQREIQEEDESKKPKAKKNRKKESKKPDYTLDPEKEKKRKRKKKADAQKAKEQEEKPKKKKKRKKKTVGDYIKEGKPDKARKKMEKLQSKAMSTLESQELEEMEEVSEEAEAVLMPSSASSSEVEFIKEYDHIYSTLGSIIRKLEERMTEKDSNVSSKDVYALMTMYSQMRETIADIRSIKDMNEQAEDLAQQVFDPAAKSAGESLVNIYYKTTSIIRQNVDDPKKVEEILEKLKIEIADQAGRLQDQFGTARDRIVDILNGGR